MENKETGERSYKKVKPMPNTLVANLGDMFARTTGFKLKATMHRVADIGCERFSVPFFFEPSFHSEVPNDLFNADSEKVKYGEYLAERLVRCFGEYKNVKFY